MTRMLSVSVCKLCLKLQVQYRTPSGSGLMPSWWCMQPAQMLPLPGRPVPAGGFRRSLSTDQARWKWDASHHAGHDTRGAVLTWSYCLRAGDAVHVSAPVLTLTSDPSSSQPAAALVQLQDGSVLRYHAGADLRALPSWASLRSPCQQVAATPDSALRAAGVQRTALASKASDACLMVDG